MLIKKLINAIKQEPFRGWGWVSVTDWEVSIPQPFLSVGAVRFYTGKRTEVRRHSLLREHLPRSTLPSSAQRTTRTRTRTQTRLRTRNVEVGPALELRSLASVSVATEQHQQRVSPRRRQSRDSPGSRRPGRINVPPWRHRPSEIARQKREVSLPPASPCLKNMKHHIRRRVQRLLIDWLT